MKGKLRNKIFLMMAAVSILPVAVAGFLSVWSIIFSHKSDIARLETELINRVEVEIDGFFLRVLEAGVKVRLDIERDHLLPDEQKFVLKNIMQEKGLIGLLDEISYIGLDGKESVRFNRFYPEDGVPADRLRDQSALEMFRVAKNGEEYIGPAHFTLSGPVLAATAPVLNKNDEIIGVTAGIIRLDDVIDIIEKTRIGVTGYVYLVNRDGAFIAGSGPFAEVAGGTDLTGIGVISEIVGRDKLSEPEWKISAGLEGAKGGIVTGKNFLGTEGQQRYENFFGQMVVAAGKFLPEYEWGLIIEWPAKEADASLNALLYNNIAVLVVVIAAVISASIIFSALIVKPIRALERGTELVAEGKFEEKIEIKTGDELEELGEAFNKMMTGLKRLEELKDEFVFIAAHELRTPVAAMKGYMSLIRDGAAGPITEKTKEFAQKVIYANDRLVQLVNDLLEVSRSEAGRLTIKVSPTDLIPPTHDVLTELEKLAEEKGVEIVHEVLPDMPKVLADPDRLKEVLVNLVGNSIKYMGPSTSLGASGERKVIISHEQTSNELITHIKDTGIGMSAEAQKKLFEKFYRISNDKTKGITGTGLGLFIVKEIIEKMGGKIWAYSEGEGMGSTFSFSLPIAS